MLQTTLTPIFSFYKSVFCYFNTENRTSQPLIVVLREPCDLRELMVVTPVLGCGSHDRKVLFKVEVTEIDEGGTVLGPGSLGEVSGWVLMTLVPLFGSNPLCFLGCSMRPCLLTKP